MVKVALVDVGEHLPIRLGTLVDTLNFMQSAYLFCEISSVPCDVLGEPDLHFQWYYIDRLIPILATHHEKSSYDILVGITHVRITREMQDDGDIYNKDYFSDSEIKDKISLITINHNVLAFNSKRKTIDQYIVFCLMSEILIHRTKNKGLYHAISKLCLFDECIDRASFAPSIEQSQICIGCRANLKQGGISNTEIITVEKILSWCRKVTGTHSTFAKTFNDPVTSLVFGVFLGWLSQNFISPGRFVYVTFASIAIVAGIFLFHSKAPRH